MEINATTYEDFDRYLTGRMEGGEREHFETKLRENDELQEEFIWLQSAISAMAITGNAVMKKQISDIGASIRFSEFEKYTPSLNKKSFWSKWWWAIGIVVIGVAVSAWYYSTLQHSQQENQNESRSVIPIDSATIPVPLNPEMPADTSCEDIEKNVLRETVPLLYGDSFIEDKMKKKVLFPYGFVAGTEKKLDSIDKKRPMNIEFRPNPRVKPAYILNHDLVLIGPYSNSSGLSFSGKGDTVTMTDDKPGYFLLIKGEGEKLLERRRPVAK